MLDKVFPVAAAAIPIAIGTLFIAKKIPAEGETDTLPPIASILMPVVSALFLFLGATTLGQHAHVVSPIVVGMLAPLFVHMAYRPILAALINPLLFLAASGAMYFFTGQEEAGNNYDTQYDALSITLYIALGTVLSLIFGLFGLLGTERSWKRRKKTEQ